MKTINSSRKALSAKSLAAWLDERELDLKLREDGDEPFLTEDDDGPKESVTEEEAQAIKELTTVTPFDKSDPVFGQLIVLSRRHFNGIFPLHAVVINPRWMEDEGNKVVQLVPFSWYSAPATSYELLLEDAKDRSPWCRVACAWASITVDWWKLDSWNIGEIEEAESIRDLFRSAFMGTDVSEDLIDRTCPAPVSHSKDPRIEYQSEMSRIVHSVQQTATEEYHPWLRG